VRLKASAVRSGVEELIGGSIGGGEKKKRRKKRIQPVR
jgi:hypothetical protein